MLPGGEIRGRIHAPRGATDIRVWIGHPAVAIHVYRKDPGDFVLNGVPPGRWKIVASAKIGKKEIGAETEAEPGDTVDLTLR